MIVFPAAFSVLEKKKRKANQGQEDTLHAVRFMLTIARPHHTPSIKKDVHFSASTVPRIPFIQVASRQLWGVHQRTVAKKYSPGEHIQSEAVV